MRMLHLKTKAVGDPLSDCSPLVSAASMGKLRLVRLLVEGGAQVNGRNPRGETPLLAACKALRGEPTGPDTVKLLTYLLQNKADPNARDRAGRTALMYACMERAGAQVASALLSAGADPSTEDYSGASALVYAVDAQHRPTLKVLMDACRAKGRDIIIITTEMDAIGGPVTRRYLNVTPSPDTSPVSCMSPSDIVLKTGSPSSPAGENIFNFRGTGKRVSSSSSSSSSSSDGRGGSRLPSCELSPVCQSDPPTPRPRLLSEPCLAIHNLACLNRAYEQGISQQRQQGGDQTTERAGREDEWREDEERRGSLAQRRRRGEDEDACQETPSTSVHKLPSCWRPHSQLRRNTLPSVTVVPPLLHLPPLVNRSDSLFHVPASKAASGAFLSHPPSSSSSSSRGSGRPLLPPLAHTSSLASLVAPSVFPWSQRRHSVQLEEIRGGWMNY